METKQTSAETIVNFISLVQETYNQFTVWHWNSQGNIHVVTEEIYKSLFDAMDSLIETYISFSGRLYVKTFSAGISTEFTEDRLVKLCVGIIDQANKICEGITDEGFKGQISEIITIMRIAVYKLGPRANSEETSEG